MKASETSGTENVIRETSGWCAIEQAAAAGRLSHSVAVVLPAVMHAVFTEMYGRLVLGNSPVWHDGTHPDLMTIGTDGTAPKVADCRALQQHLMLHPVVSSARLGVIGAADLMQQSASNSMLKITEEPPSYGYILFLAENDNFIPTIRSRVWLITIDLPAAMVESRPVPADLPQWAEWMSTSRKPSAEILCLEIQGWSKYLYEHGDFERAQQAELIYRTAMQRHLSVSLIQDLAFAILEEGIPCNEIFSNLW